MKKILYMKPLYGAAIITLLFLSVRILAFVGMSNNTKNNAVYSQMSVQDGYEPIPAYYEVEASWSKLLDEAKQLWWGKLLHFLSWLLCFSPILVVLWFYGLEKGANALGLFVGGILWLIASFGPVGSRYTKTFNSVKVCADQYDKDANYDHLFPAMNKGKLGDFYKSCK